MEGTFSAADVDKYLRDVRMGLDQQALHRKIAQWTATPSGNGEFTEEEILSILSDPDSYNIPKLEDAPHLPHRKFMPCDVILVFVLWAYPQCLSCYVLLDGYFYLYQRPGVSRHDVPPSDGIQWARRNKLDSVGREREDYVLHKSKVLCSFKSQREETIHEVCILSCYCGWYAKF
jgi:hypothetical protein